MTTLVNVTPHALNFNNGMVLKPSGTVARVSSTFQQVGEVEGLPIFSTEYGEIEDLPESVADTFFIVSAIVLEAIKREGKRTDCLGPATFHKEVVRNEKGQIQSVPGFTC